MTALAMFLLPAATARLGATALAPLLCAALAALAALVFSDLPFRWHAAVAIAFFAAEGMLGATLQSVGSLLVAVLSLGARDRPEGDSGVLAAAPP